MFAVRFVQLRMTRIAGKNKGKQLRVEIQFYYFDSPKKWNKYK
jgi:hypothetical protein